MTTNVETSNLGINILSYGDYDNIQSKSNQELYVVKNDASDTDNAISSRTYADVGRDAVHYGPTAPTSPHAIIWVDTSVDPTLIQPASIDMNNLSATGIVNLQGLITPNYSAGSALSLTVGGTYTLQNTGWIYITVDTSSEVKLLLTDSSGADLTHIKTDVNCIASDKLFMKKNEVIYVDTLSGTSSITFYPCKGSI